MPQDQRAPAGRLKGHIAAEPQTGLVTECALTATTADGPTGVGLLAEEQPGLEVLGGTHYGSGQTARPCALPAIPRRSSRSHCPARCRAGSPSTTSRSTGKPARPVNRPGMHWLRVQRSGWPAATPKSGVRDIGGADRIDHGRPRTLPMTSPVSGDTQILCPRPSEVRVGGPIGTLRLPGSTTTTTTTTTTSLAL
jgi:hypothetical protein